MQLKRRSLLTLVLLAALLGSACSAQSESVSAPARASEATFHVIELVLPTGAYAQPQQRRSFVQQVLKLLKALPDIAAVAVSTPPQPRTAMPERDEFTSSPKANLNYSAVTADYFRAAQLELISGRFFYEEEQPNVKGLVIISESLARRLIPDEDAIGKRIILSTTDQQGPTLEIVGVVEDDEDTPGHKRADIYGLYDQDPASTVSLLVRGRSGSQLDVEKLKAEIQAIDKQVTTIKVESL